MPNRNYNANNYRYGFNGKENDKSINEGAQDYGMRIYDKRLGRFFSRDPLIKQYPELTPYQFASNRPIDGVDLDGKEWSVSSKMVKGKDNKPKLVITLNVKIQYNIDAMNNLPTNFIPTAKQYVESLFRGSYLTSDGLPVEIETVADFVQVHNYNEDKSGIIMYFNNTVPPQDLKGKVGYTDPKSNSQTAVINVYKGDGYKDYPLIEMIGSIGHELGHTVLGAGHPVDYGSDGPIVDPNNNFMNWGSILYNNKSSLGQLLRAIINISNESRKSPTPTTPIGSTPSMNNSSGNSAVTEDLGTGTYQNARFLD